jgi:PAS domain S-box-containing protein
MSPSLPSPVYSFENDPEFGEQFFESSPDCVKILDLHGHLLSMNRNGQCVMEIHDFGGLCGAPWPSLWPRESHDSIQRALEAARSGAQGRFEAFCPTAKGTPKWWDVMVTPIFDSEGQIVRLLSVSRDVTAMRQAREELRGTAARLQFTLAASQVGEWEIDLATGRKRCSLRHDECFGYQEPVAEWSFEKFIEHVHPNDRERVKDLFDTAIKDHTDCQFECRVVWSDKSVHWISVRGSVYRSNDGTPERMIGIVFDITERKRAEALADGQKKALELAAEGAPLPAVLDVLARAAEQDAGGTLRISVLLLDEEARLRHGAAPSLPQTYCESIDGTPVSSLFGPCATTASFGEEVIARDFETDPRWPGFRDVASEYGLRSGWSQPIFSSKGKVLATFAAYHHEVWEPTPRERQSIALLVNTASLVLGQRREAEERKAVEAALRISEERFRSLVLATSQVLWSAAPDGRVIEDSPSWREFTGQTYEQWKDFGWLDAIHPEDREQVEKVWKESVANRRLYEIRYRVLRADGEYRWTEARGVPIFNPDGSLREWMGANTDITEAVRAEEVLKLSEERLRFFDRLNETTRLAEDSHAIMSETTRLLGEYLQATRCVYADVEPDNNHVSIRDNWMADGAISTVGAYSLDSFGPRIAAELREGRTLVIRDANNELGPSGGADMLGMIEVRALIACPLVKKGKLVAVLAMHQNGPRDWSANEVGLVEEVAQRSWAHIERVRMTEALRRSEAHLSSLFKQNGAGIAEADLEGRLVQVNERFCQMLQRTHEELIGKNLRELIHPDDVAENLALFTKHLEDGESFEIDSRYLLPKGRTLWASKSVAPIRIEEGKPIQSMVAVVRDITDRKRVEEELLKADRRKDDFLAMLAHELRNPLAPIRAAAELMEMMQLDEARLKQTSQIIARQVRHMTGLVDDLLDVSRVTRGLVTVEKSPQDLKSIVSNAVEQVRPLIEKHHHHLSMDLAREPGHVAGDQKRLVQVLTNLLNNAAKYTPEGGNIHLKMDVTDEWVILSVRDDGIGIGEDLKPHVFDLFAQAKRSSDRSQGGLGVGLALVKSLVELHGGTVTCSSEGLHKGSEFKVTLPRLLEQIGSSEHRKANRAVPAPEKRLRVLVVDDNADAAHMLAMFLEASGHQVLIEHESHRALERAAKEAPDVCVLDIGLPDMDGNELARRLRSQRETAHSLLIAVTGYGQEQDRENTRAAGFKHHFVKPIDSAKLAGLLVEPSKS